MAAELIAHRGEELVRVGVGVTALETAQERERDDGGGHVEVHGLEDRPAPLAGVGDPRSDPVELRVLLERARGEIEKPRANDAPVPPDLGDLGEVELEVLLLLQRLILKQGFLQRKG